jgi:hypothetical protein
MTHKCNFSGCGINFFTKDILVEHQRLKNHDITNDVENIFVNIEQNNEAQITIEENAKDPLKIEQIDGNKNSGKNMNNDANQNQNSKFELRKNRNYFRE